MLPPLLMFPVQFVALIDEALREARLTNTDMMVDLGYKRPSDWSNEKSGRRSLNLHRLARASVAFQRAFCKQWLAAIEVEAPSGAVSQLDLLVAILDGIKELKPRRQAKASLRPTAAESERAS